MVKWIHPNGDTIETNGTVYTVIQNDNTMAQSQPMCGDCLVPINECGHGYDLRRKRDRHHTKGTRHRNRARVLYN